MLIDQNVSQLVKDHESLVGLFAAQPAMTRHFLDSQAGSVLAGVEAGRIRIRYQLPDRIVLLDGTTLAIPSSSRPQQVGGLLARMRRADRLELLLSSLVSLEHSLNPGLSVCGSLLRYSLAHHILYRTLPDGRSVQYRPESSDDIPSIPVGIVPPGALLAGSDAVAEENGHSEPASRLQVPFVEAARRFYLPQWVAFGEDGRLLAGSMAEAEAMIASLQKSIRLLREALAFCPSLVADETYQRKRAGLLGQLVNQGRALARAYTGEIIAGVRARGAAGSLNRGLQISLPFFDDDSLSLQTYPVEVIPAGRILFIPAFVVRAARLSAAKVRQDRQFSTTTRRHLLAQLDMMEHAFNGHSRK
jgi:hypothetical protein